MLHVFHYNLKNNQNTGEPLKILKQKNDNLYSVLVKIIGWTKHGR